MTKLNKLEEQLARLEANNKSLLEQLGNANHTLDILEVMLGKPVETHYNDPKFEPIFYLSNLKLDLAETQGEITYLKKQNEHLFHLVRTLIKDPLLLKEYEVQVTSGQPMEETRRNRNPRYR